MSQDIMYAHISYPMDYSYYNLEESDNIRYEDWKYNMHIGSFKTREEAYDKAISIGLTPCPTCCYRNPKPEFGEPIT